MFRNVLLAASFLPLFASIALSQSSEFYIPSLDDATQTRVLVEVMAVYGVDIEELIAQIPSAKAMGLNQFDYRRYYDEEVLAIKNAPTLWPPGELVTLSYFSVAQLNKYDFDQGVYLVCVPTMFVPINTSRNGVWPPNVQIVFAPSNSTPGNGARVGKRCDPPGSLWDYVGKGIFDFNLIRVKMNPDQAEQLYQQSLSSRLGEGVVNFSVKCTAGPGTTNGAFCSVETGYIGVDPDKYFIDSKP